MKVPVVLNRNEPLVFRLLQFIYLQMPTVKDPITDTLSVDADIIL